MRFHAHCRRSVRVAPEVLEPPVVVPESEASVAIGPNDTTLVVEDQAAVRVRIGSSIGIGFNARPDLLEVLG